MLTSLELSEKEGIMSLGISINFATAALEGIYKRLCCMYISVKNTLVYDHVGYLSPLRTHKVIGGKDSISGAVRL